MSRKRFIKLLMSHGISRNEAVKTAAAYNSLNFPYERAYENWQSLIDSRLVYLREHSAIGALRRYYMGRC